MSTPEQTQVTTPKKKGSEIDGIYEALKASEESEVVKLPESVFVGNFLPFFCGEPIPEAVQNQVNLGTWIGIAGSPFRPVDLLAANGEIVARVPPVFEMNGVGVSDRQGFSLQGMLQRMTQLNESFPVRAKKYFDEHMALMNITADPESHVSRYVEMWNKIFARYDKPLFVTKKQLIEQEKKAEAERPELDFGDDLL